MDGPSGPVSARVARADRRGTVTPAGDPGVHRHGLGVGDRLGQEPLGPVTVLRPPPLDQSQRRLGSAHGRHRPVAEVQVRVDGPLEVVDGRVEVTGEASGDAERTLDGPEAHDRERRHDRQVGVRDQLAGRRAGERRVAERVCRLDHRQHPRQPRARTGDGGKAGRDGPIEGGAGPVGVAGPSGEHRLQRGKVSSASIRLGDEVTSVTSSRASASRPCSQRTATRWAPR